MGRPACPRLLRAKRAGARRPPPHNWTGPDGLHFGSASTPTGSARWWSSRCAPNGKKEPAALADGHRESTESWARLLRDAKRRGMRAPVLAVGDDALGFWAALREVFPATAEQHYADLLIMPTWRREVLAAA